MFVAGVGPGKGYRRRPGLQYQVNHLPQGNIGMVRPQSAAPANVHPHPFRRQFGYRIVQRRHVHGRHFPKLRQSQMGKNLMAAQGQVGTIQLQQKAGVHNGLILAFHHFGQGVQVFLLAGVVLIGQETGNLTGRGSGHKDFRGRDGGSSGFQVVNILFHGRPVGPGNGAGAGRAQLKGRGKGFQQFGQFGKLRIAHGQRRAFPVKAGQPVFYIDRIVHPALLAIIDDIQPHGGLPRRHFVDGIAHRRIQIGPVGQAGLLLLHQQAQHCRGPRQAAGVGSQDSVDTPLHNRRLARQDRNKPGWMPPGNCRPL